MKGGNHMSTALKYSRQRESIKNYLMNTKDHPTADMVYQYVRKEYPKVSLGTVYRNLSLLAELGEIIKLDCGDGYDRFDANMDPHYHVVCTSCNELEDLHMESIDHIKTIANATYKGIIIGHHTIFYGLCEKCKNKQEER